DGFQCGEAGVGAWEGRGDSGLVGRATLGRRRHALDEHVPDQRAVAVAVQRPDRLVHPRPGARARRLKRRPGERLVDVTGDRARLVDLEPVVLEGRDPAERMAREVARRGPARSEDVDLLEAVADALLLQGQPYGADIDAIGGAVDDGRAHR